MPIFRRFLHLITFVSALSTVMMMPSSIFFSSYLFLCCYCYPLGIKSIVWQGTAITNLSITNKSTIHSPIMNGSTLGNSSAGTLTVKPNTGAFNLTSELSNEADSNNGNGKGGTGASGLSRQASSVMSAANAFANDVMTVSSSLNALGRCTDSTKIRSLAQRGYYAEKDEDAHRAVLNRYVASNSSHHL
jgi:hypothetical protein